jgi:stage II sporulation protein R
MKNLLTIVVCFVLIFIFIGLMPVHGEEQVYDSVLRLHVLANSDSDEDQALKLCVRDAILEAATPMLKGCTTQAEAIARLEAGREVLLEGAREVTRTEGEGESVELIFGTEK